MSLHTATAVVARGPGHHEGVLAIGQASDGQGMLEVVQLDHRRLAGAIELGVVSELDLDVLEEQVHVVVAAARKTDAGRRNGP
jgi:hypothetical protein